MRLLLVTPNRIASAIRTALASSGHDIVDTKNIGAGEHRRHRGGETAFKPLVGFQTQNLTDKALRETPTTSGWPRAGKAAQAAQQLQIVLEILPKPIPGSMTIACGSYAGIQRFIELRGEKVSHFAHDVADSCGSACMVRGVPCICIRITGTFSSATSEAIAESKRKALMSLTMSAPASSAARATWAL